MTPASGTDPDLTRKERREQARSERKAMEAAAAQAARRTRMMQLGGVIAAVVVIVVVILVATSGGKKEGLATGSQKNSTVAAVTSEVGGIHQSGVVLGNPNAPVTMQYFGDLECPICKEFTLGALPPLIAKYVRTGKMKIEYHSMETATREQETFRTQQIAALAAGKQNLAWYFIELFYHEQGQEDSGYVTEKYLQGLAEQVPGLNLSRWQSDRGDKALEEEVLKDEKEAAEIGFSGTPSFTLGKTGQKLKPFSSTSLESAAAFEPTINKLAS
jgi:protein-disulfide isomerase